MAGMADKGLTREFLAERDARIFQMRRNGTPVSEIARKLGMKPAAVNAAVTRQLQKLNREALMAYPEVLRLELERLDALQSSIWPLTQHRKVTAEDGTEHVVEPDLKAVAEARALIQQRSKLLGMEQTNVNLLVEEVTPQRAVLAGHTTAAAADAYDPATEARQMLELMARSGVLPAGDVEAVLGALPAGEIHDAEIIEPEEGTDQ
jgi:hypothetical protein